MESGRKIFRSKVVKPCVGSELKFAPSKNIEKVHVEDFELFCMLKNAIPECEAYDTVAMKPNGEHTS